MLLVRHSLPKTVPGVPSSQWHLSEKGRLRCKPLAERLAKYAPEAVFSSPEPKATETGRLIALALEAPLHAVDDLREHDRSNVDFFEAQEEFQATLSKFFERPRSLVFGLETADQAHERVSSALADLIEGYPAQNLAVVSHGTVITLFVARATGLTPLPFWKRLGTPSFVVLSLPKLHLLEVVESV